LLARKHQFLLFDDRKFADIGSTVAAQYKNGFVEADVVTVHGVGGPGTLQGLKQAVDELNSRKLASNDGSGDGVLERGALLVAEMSSDGNLATGQYTEGMLVKAVNIVLNDFDNLMSFFFPSQICLYRCFNCIF
jgi:orotidine-5'-phosphate decarboxylase